jgi:hypothetical protein
MQSLARAAELLTLDTMVALANIENAQRQQDLWALVVGRLSQFVLIIVTC